MSYAPFERLQTPIWIYDIQRLRMVWANSAGLWVWNASSLEELLTRNPSTVSEVIQVRLNHYLDQFKQGQSIQEAWTFYPQGHPISVHCLCSGITLDDGRIAMLVEGHLPQSMTIKEETLRSVEAFRHISSPVSLFTPAGEPLLQNPAAIATYPHTPSLTARFRIPAIAQQALQVLEQQPSWQADCEVITQRGIRWHRLELHKIQEPVTGADAYLLNETDITDFKQLEVERQSIADTLKANADHTQGVLEALTEGVVMHQANGQITACNRRAQEILGMPLTQIRGKTSLDPAWRTIHQDGTPFPGEDHPAMVTLRTGVPQTEVVMGIYRPDDTLIWVSINSQPIWQSGQERPTAVVTSFADITTRIQAETTLRQQAEMLQAIVNHIPIMLALFNQRGEIQFINQALEEMLGWSLTEWQQQDLITQCYPEMEERQRVLQHIQAATGEWQDFKSLTAAGHYLETSWANIRLSSGELIGIGQDISHRKQIEETLRHKAQRDRLMMQIVQRISQSLDLRVILETAVSEMRQLLQTHRVLICQLHADQVSGSIIAESVAPECQSIRACEFHSHCLIAELCVHQLHSNHQTEPPFSMTSDSAENNDQFHRIEDIYTAALSDTQTQTLERFQVRANLVIPIHYNQKDWGFLVVQHCSQPRQWQSDEIELLQQLANQLAIAIQQSELYQKLQQANQELQHVATHDKLTGLANRRYFDNYLEQEWRRHIRESAPLALILGDIDYFKSYNDTFGHVAGDECLVQVARAINRAVKRPADLVARYGGEEFAIVLPQTNLAGAIRAGERIRQEIAQAEILHVRSLIKPHITLSLGIACVYPLID